MGVKQSDSVRDIYVGNLDGFVTWFPNADLSYCPLGHIHRPQVVAKRNVICYCGSPIPLSFDELKSKAGLCGWVCRESERTISQLAVPTFQPPCWNQRRFERNRVAKLNQYIGLEEGQSVWLSIEVQAQDYLSDLQERMRALTEGLNVEVLQLRRVERATPRLEQESAETLSELTPMDVFEKRVIFLEEFEQILKSTFRTNDYQVQASDGSQPLRCG